LSRYKSTFDNNLPTFATPDAHQAVTSPKHARKTPEKTATRRTFAPLDIHILFHTC
jgi:hypothetical protein